MVVDKTSTNGWVFLKKTEHVELWKKATEGSAVNLVKVCSSEGGGELYIHLMAVTL